MISDNTFLLQYPLQQMDEYNKEELVNMSKLNSQVFHKLHQVQELHNPFFFYKNNPLLLLLITLFTREIKIKKTSAEIFSKIFKTFKGFISS